MFSTVSVCDNSYLRHLQTFITTYQLHKGKYRALRGIWSKAIQFISRSGFYSSVIPPEVACMYITQLFFMKLEPTALKLMLMFTIVNKCCQNLSHVHPLET